jgi:hypothetical protein
MLRFRATSQKRARCESGLLAYSTGYCLEPCLRSSRSTITTAA